MAGSSAAVKPSVVPPDRLEPMLAVPAPEPFDSPEKIFEVKWDGVRAITVISGGRARLHTRGLRDITAPFADVAQSVLSAVRSDGVVLDGELVAMGREGVPELPRVLQRMLADGARRPPVNFEVFDILYLRGEALLREPLWKRKLLLHEIVRPNANVHVTPFEDREGIALFDAAMRLGFEGIVAKDKHSFYLPGKRSRHWLKIKQSRTADLVVGGYTFGGNRKELFGSLLLGAYEKGKLYYVGSVSGGFRGDDFKRIYAIMSRLHTAQCPFVNPPQRVERFLFWCQPSLVVQVSYGEFTLGKGLRFSIFGAIRPDVAAEDCTIAALSGG